MKRFILSLYVLLFIIVFAGCASNGTGISKNELNSNSDTENNELNSDSDKAHEEIYQVLIYDYSDSIPSARHERETDN